MKHVENPYIKDLRRIVIVDNRSGIRGEILLAIVHTCICLAKIDGHGKMNKNHNFYILVIKNYRMKIFPIGIDRVIYHLVSNGFHCNIKEIRIDVEQRGYLS